MIVLPVVGWICQQSQLVTHQRPLLGMGPCQQQESEYLLPCTNPLVFGIVVDSFDRNKTATYLDGLSRIHAPHIRIRPADSLSVQVVFLFPTLF